MTYTEEHIKVMQAFLDGAKIKCVGKTSGELRGFFQKDGKYNCHKNPSWSWDRVDYIVDDPSANEVLEEIRSVLYAGLDNYTKIVKLQNILPVKSGGYAN